LPAVQRDELDRLAAERGGFVRTASVEDNGAVALFIRFEGAVPTLGCTGPTVAIARAKLLHSLARDGDPALDASLCAVSDAERPDELALHLAPALAARGFAVSEPEQAWEVLEALRSTLGEKHFRGGLIVLGLTPGDLDRTLAVLDRRVH
jgi:hypothetical protein